MANLSVENLYDLSDDQVSLQVHRVFLTQLENGPSVHATFFASVGGPPIGSANPDWVDEVASVLVCSSLSRTSMYSFGRTVNQAAADAFWESRLAVGNPNAIQAGRALYDWAFPVYCQSGGLTFQDYLNSNPAAWAQQLAAHVTLPSFINTQIAKLLAQDADWPAKLNLVFYKLSRLDSTQVVPVVEAWTRAFPDKGISVQWQSYNFVPSNLFQPDQFLSAVNAAIGVPHSFTITTTGPAPMPISFNEYGVAVEDFLKGTASRLGFATGASADSIREVSAFSGGGCFLAGTPVHLHSGEQLPIEAIQNGHKVLAQGGVSSEHSDEEVVIEARHSATVYGINDVAPFFTAEHLFWTKDGWKAIDPDAARADNPDRTVGKLDVGDIVYRLVNVAPLHYDEIEISKLPSIQVEAGTQVHGLHLTGERSYHANGFLVGMNYPIITAKRLAGAFAKLTPWERQLVKRQLEPILPLLSLAIGSFIERPIREALE